MQRRDKMAAKNNLKGFAFTLDSIFALVIAVAGTSILLYAHFANTYMYNAPASEASSILQSLSQTSVASASLGSKYASYMVNSWAGGAYTWAQFGRDQYLSSNSSIGPATGYLLYSFKASNAILPVVAVDQGVAAFVTSNNLYAINATTGNLITNYPLSISAVRSAPAIYKDRIIYADSNGRVVAVKASNALVQLWSTSIGAVVNTPIVVENNYILVGSSNTIYLLNPMDGTQVTSTTLPASGVVNPPTYSKGEFMVSTDNPAAPNYLYSYVLKGNTLTQVWSYPLASASTTPQISDGNTVIISSGNTLYRLTLGGNMANQIQIPTTQIMGLATSGGYVYAATSNSITKIDQSGNMIFWQPTQSNSQNTTPSLGSGIIYALVNGTDFEGFDMRSGAVQWDAPLPSLATFSSYSSIALAYGNAYLADSDTLYVFGVQKAQPSESLMQSIVGMYARGVCTYPNLLLREIYNSTNIGIFFNSTYAPSTKAASFNGVSSYLHAPMINPSYATVAVWVVPRGSNPSTDEAIVSNLKSVSGVLEGFGLYETANSYNVVAKVDVGGTLQNVALGTTSSNALAYVAFTYDGNYIKTYLNGALAHTVATNGVITYAPSPTRTYIGWDPNYGTYFNGIITDVQIYDVALSSSQVAQLYNAGQFGVPTNITRLDGWWPLNGDTNDYSGNFRLGIPINVVYTGNNIIPATLNNAYLVSSASMPFSIGAGSKPYNVSVISWR